MILKQLWLLLLGLLIVALAALAGFLYWKDFTIDLSSLQPRINKTLSDTLKRPVEIHGPSQLVLSFKPTLLVNNIQLPSTQDVQKPIRIQAIEINFDLSNMSIGDWGRLLRLNAVLPADIRVMLSNTTLTADGMITYQDDHFSSDLAISLNGQHLNDINFIFAQPLIDIGPYSIEADLQQQQQSIHLQNIVATIKDTTIKGDISYDNVNQRHLIKTSLETPALIIPQTIELQTKAPLTKVPRTTKTQSQNQTLEIPGAVAMLGDIDFELIIKTDRLQYLDNQADNFKLALNFEKGKIKKAQIDSNINDTPVSIQFGLDLQDLITKAGSADPAKIDAAIHLSATTHQADVQGALYFPSESIHFSFNTAIYGSELGNLSDLFKSPLPNFKNYALKAVLSGKNNKYSITDITAKFDETNITGNIALNNVSSRPSVKANLNIDYLPIDNIVVADTQASETQDTSFLDTIDADIDLNIGKLFSQFLVLHNINLSGKLKNGQITPVDMKFNTGKTRYLGQLSFLTNKSRKKSTELNLSLTAENFHLSEIAILTHYWDFFDIQSPHAILSLNSQGNSFDELLSATSIKLNASTGTFKLIDQTNKTFESWPLKDITSNITPEFVRASSVVMHGQTPLEYRLRLSRPKILAFPTEPLDFQLSLLGSNSQLNIKLASALPFDWQQQLYFAEMEGENLSDLNTLLSAKLPKLGPYTLTTKMNFPKDGIELTDATATINDSLFEGTFKYQTSNGQPMIKASVNSDYVNLDDIVPKKLNSAKTEKSEPDNSGSEIDRPVARLLGKIHQTLGTKNILVDFNLNNIKTEGIELNKLQMTLKTGNEKVELSPFEVSYLDGKISSYMHINRADEQLDFKLTTRIDNLDYGFLAYYVENNSSTKGIVSMDLELSATSPSYNQLANNLNGHFNLIVWPEIVGNYALEVWGQGILGATFATFIPAKKHKFNCIVGYFDIKNGMMQSKALYVDTSRMVINGTGTINLADRQLDIVVIPEAKRAQILTNEVPMQIKGPFDDYVIQAQGGLIKGGIFGSIVRVPTKLVTFPYRAITGITVPEGSRINCEDVN